MLSDEEKKAIEILKDREYDFDELYSTFRQSFIKPYDKSIGIILDLIEKQSKEIVRLQNIKRKDIQDLINNENENIYKNYISKDKIKAKIEEYEKLINECPMNDEEIFCKECTEKCSFNQTIDILQSLLEKE